MEKAHWFNHQYLQKHSDAELAQELKKHIGEAGVRNGLTREAGSFTDEQLQKIVGLVKERLSFPKQLWEQAYFFFEAPDAYDEKVVKKRWSEDMPQILRAWCAEAEKTGFSTAALEALTQDMIGKNAWNAGKVFNSMRLALVGASIGPHIFDIMEIIGKAETLARIEAACGKIGRGE